MKISRLFALHNNFIRYLLLLAVFATCGASRHRHEFNAENSISSSGKNEPPAFCKQTAECIAKVRKMATESSRFWFGDHWRFNCAQHTHRKSPVQCINPRELHNFYSLGSRLFRVNTFTTAYLDNLRIFPRIKISTHPGIYRACDHEFTVEANGSIDAHPNSAPVATFHLREETDNVDQKWTPPIHLDWPQLRKNDSYIILFLDVSFGMLKGLAVDFPRSTKFIHEYEPLENFRLHQPIPLVVLIFEKREAEYDWEQHFYQPKDSLFDLSQFMLEHQLEDGLIGLNWILVDGDAYSIEKQRIKGNVDNCHALVKKKLNRDKRWRFVETFTISEMDSSLSISVIQPESTYRACCKAVSTRKEEIFLDPLADRRIPSGALRFKLPTITSLRSLESLTLDSYQRSLRHYVVLKEELYTLVLADPAQKYLYWMIVDITAESLSAGSLNDATTIATYMPPIPNTPDDCLFAVFFLFKQPAGVKMREFYSEDHALRSRHCNAHCIYRTFEVEQFKSFHRMQLSAISWMEVCYDFYEASFEIRRILQELANDSERAFSPQKISTAGSNWKGSQKKNNAFVGMSREMAKRRIETICANVHRNKSQDLECILNENSAHRTSQMYTSIMIVIILLTFVVFC
ncbi:hypothetical protein DdX_07078 [Ditylenchus destructor]|uniref:Uncharacterized protein n=1 Tax=Ditylenchus destructor TaxID=166010 RepID=A0AAD4N542_9BILA|nr:hypothetical protein DdX_07078 [Ditylenchus destructor]